MIRAALVSVAGAAAVCAASIPAIVGMMGNTSFSHHIPVRAPLGASAPRLATDGRGGELPEGRSATPAHGSTSREAAEPPGEDSHDHGRHSHNAEPSEHSMSGREGRRHSHGRDRADIRGGTRSERGRSGSGRRGDDHSGRG
jgi:hypothetical protein